MTTTTSLVGGGNTIVNNTTNTTNTTNLFGGISSYTNSLIQRLVTVPSRDEILLIDKVYDAIGSYLTYLDAFYWLALSTSELALTNLANPLTYPLVVTGSPTFTADRGYTGDGAAAYLATNIDPRTGTKFAQNSAFYAVGVNTNVAEVGGVIGMPGTGYAGLHPLIANGTQGSTTLCNTTGATFTNAHLSSIGVWSELRTASTGYIVSRDTLAVQTITNKTSSAVTGSRPITLLRSNSGYTTRQISFAMIGGNSITAQQAADLIGTFMGIGLHEKGLF